MLRLLCCCCFLFVFSFFNWTVDQHHLFAIKDQKPLWPWIRQDLPTCFQHNYFVCHSLIAALTFLSFPKKTPNFLLIFLVVYCPQQHAAMCLSHSPGPRCQDQLMCHRIQKLQIKLFSLIQSTYPETGPTCLHTHCKCQVPCRANTRVLILKSMAWLSWGLPWPSNKWGTCINRYAQSRQV